MKRIVLGRNEVLQGQTFDEDVEIVMDLESVVKNCTFLKNVVVRVTKNVNWNEPWTRMPRFENNIVKGHIRLDPLVVFMGNVVSLSIP